jgi:hypothetical protein
MARSDGHETQLLETGEILFFYRPRVQEEDPSSLEDVQRFLIVLRPKDGSHLRLLVVGRKRLPEVGAHERNWGFVDLVTEDVKAVEEALRGEERATKTRGVRHQPSARPAGAGVYAVTLEDGRMHLSYELDLPEEPGEVQRTLKLAPEASFALSVRNPEMPRPRGAGTGPPVDAEFPEDLQQEFRGRRFAAEDVRLLDIEGAEFVMVGARRDPERAYGLDLEAEAGLRGGEDVMRGLRRLRAEQPTKPLFEGRWD